MEALRWLAPAAIAALAISACTPCMDCPDTDFVVQAEIYDPETGTCALTGSLYEGRGDHSAIVLATGQVLFIGGVKEGGGGAQSSRGELYDPETGTFAALTAQRYVGHRPLTVLLPTGDVLIGGQLVYEPAMSRYVALRSSSDPGILSTTLLQSGNVLIIRYSPAGSAEVLDPVTRTYELTGSLITARRDHSATLLRSGEVLIAGGTEASVGGKGVKSAEIYDPASGTFRTTGSMVNVQYGHSAMLLPSGKVLTLGGMLQHAPEMYDPETETFSEAPRAATDANGPSCLGFAPYSTVLPSGLVLNTGRQTTELYDPDTGACTSTGAFHAPRAHHTATLLPSGKVLIVGGYISNR